MMKRGGHTKEKIARVEEALGDGDLDDEDVVLLNELLAADPATAALTKLTSLLESQMARLDAREAEQRRALSKSFKQNVKLSGDLYTLSRVTGGTNLGGNGPSSSCFCVGASSSFEPAFPPPFRFPRCVKRCASGPPTASRARPCRPR